MPIAYVSIHAFRGEGDCRSFLHSYAPPSFNPRLPGGRRHAAGNTTPATRKFQSTPSGGKATLEALANQQKQLVSIHAFRGEGDVGLKQEYMTELRFNPRLPGGRRPGSAGRDGRAG